MPESTRKPRAARAPAAPPADAAEQEAETPPGAEEAPAPSSPDDELRRRYREALDRKKAQSHGSAGGPASGHGVGPAANVSRRRTFRRKSG